MVDFLSWGWRSRGCGLSRLPECFVAVVPAITRSNHESGFLARIPVRASRRTRPDHRSTYRHLHEGTPVQLLAAVVGLNITWMFWSSLVLLVIRTRTRRGNRGLGVGQ